MVQQALIPGGRGHFLAAAASGRIGLAAASTRRAHEAATMQRNVWGFLTREWKPASMRCAS